jgi:hypothetical protein
MANKVSLVFARLHQVAKPCAEARYQTLRSLAQKTCDEKRGTPKMQGVKKKTCDEERGAQKMQGVK